MKKRKPIIDERGRIPDFSNPQVRKKGNKGLLKLVYFLLIIIFITSILSFLFTYEKFNIDSYEIKGVKYSNKSNIETFAKQYINRNIFTMNKLSLVYSCKKINEIHSVTIKKKLPNKIVIIIKEEEPCVCFKTPNGRFLFNDEGYCFHKLKDNEKTIHIPIILSQNLNISQNSNIKDISTKDEIFILKNPNGEYFINSEYICYGKVKKSDSVDNLNILETKNKIKIGKKYEFTDFLYVSPTNTYIIQEGVCKPVLDKKETENLPKIISKNNININDKFNLFKNYQTNFLFNLGKTVYNNNLNIASIYIKNDCEVMLLTNNNMLIEFGPAAEILDKCYLLKQIYIEKKELLDKIKQIYIINSNTATYKLKEEKQDPKKTEEQL